MTVLVSMLGNRNRTDQGVSGPPQMSVINATGHRKGKAQ
jgi:hypothetical protein